MNCGFGEENVSFERSSVQLTFTLSSDEYSEPLAIRSSCYQSLFSKVVLLDQRSSRKFDFE